MDTKTTKAVSDPQILKLNNKRIQISFPNGNH